MADLGDDCEPDCPCPPGPCRRYTSCERDCGPECQPACKTNSD